jgi:hypothetical protein
MTAYPVLQGLFCAGITRRLGRFMMLTSRKWRVSQASAHVAGDSSEPGRFPATIHRSAAGRSRAEAKDPAAPVTGPGNRSGEKTGMNRRTADARFSTTSGISPDSPQSRSAGLRHRTL